MAASKAAFISNKGLAVVCTITGYGNRALQEGILTGAGQVQGGSVRVTQQPEVERSASSCHITPVPDSAVLTGRVGNRQLAANSLCQEVRDLCVARNSLSVSSLRVLPEGVLFAFSSEDATGPA